MQEAEFIDDSGDEAANARPLKLRERTPADIEREVMKVSAESSRDELCAALDAADWLFARAKTIDRLMKQIAIGWIDRNGEFDIGDVHYSAGFSLSVKCVDVLQTGQTVLKVAEGDFDRFLSVLVSQPFKHAAVRNIIGKKLHDRLFKAHRTGRLINGVPDRILKHADIRFLPNKNNP